MATKADTAPVVDSEKGGFEHNSMESSSQPSIDLSNYYDEHPGSVVVDPE